MSAGIETQLSHLNVYRMPEIGIFSCGVVFGIICPVIGHRRALQVDSIRLRIAPAGRKRWVRPEIAA